MLDIIRNILSFIATFLVISTSTMLLLQGVVCCIKWNWKLEPQTDHKIIAVGIIIALALIPLYYFPA